MPIDLDAIDPNAPTEEELDYLSGGNALLKNALRQSGRAVADKISTLRARRAAEPAQRSEVEHDADLVPDDPYEDTHDTDLDRAVESIDILDAYARWIGKMSPRVGPGQRENIMVSCPIPGHADEHPSTWVNLDKQTWMCGKCDRGGDKYDLAAIGKGFAYPDTYKTNGTFPEMRRQMAADFGYVVRRSPSGVDIVEVMEVVTEDDEDGDLDPDPGGNGPGTTPEPDGDGSPWADNPDEPEDTPAPSETAPAKRVKSGPDLFLRPEPYGSADEEVEEGDELATVTALRPDPDVAAALADDALLIASALDWESIIPENTFIREYMEQNCKYDIPHEFHLWLALQAIAFANGFHIRIEDVPQINGNLFVVLVGPTGLGKSRATYSLRTVVREVLPWTGTDSLPGTGVKILGGIESGQALVKGITHEYDDPAPIVPGMKVSQPNVRGWTLPEEFAGFVKKAMRMGSDFKERAIEFFDVGRDGEVAVNAIKHGGEIKAVGPFLQVTSTTQPDAIHTYLSSEDSVSGFLNRFVFVTGPSRDARPPRWTMAHAPDLTRAIDGLKAIVAFCEAHDGLDMPYTPDGDAAWTALYGKIEALKEETGPMAVRLDLVLKKVMLLMAINEHRTEIDANLVMRMEPVMKHLLANYTKITGDLYWRSDDACQDAITAYIDKKNKAGSHPRKKEIVDSLKRPTVGRSRFDIGRALDLLEKLEIIKTVKVKSSRGPDRMGYKINDLDTLIGGGYET